MMIPEAMRVVTKRGCYHRDYRDGRSAWSVSPPHEELDRVSCPAMRSRKVLTLALLGVVVSVLFPPWIYSSSPSSLGYSFLLSPPEVGYGGALIDWSRLALQGILLASVAGLAILIPAAAAKRAMDAPRTLGRELVGLLGWLALLVFALGPAGLFGSFLFEALEAQGRKPRG